MDVNTRATLPQTWGARVRALDAVAPSPSPTGLSTADTKLMPGTPRSPAETAANSHSNSAEVSPAPSLSNSLSSSLGLSSSFVLASHLLAAPTPINTPNFGSTYIHRAARAGSNPSTGIAPAEGRDSLNENLGGTIDFRKWLVRSRPPRRWVGGDEDDEDDDAVDEIEEENEDDEVEVGDDEDEEENLDEDVENKRDAKQKGQAIPQPRR